MHRRDLTKRISSSRVHYGVRRILSLGKRRWSLYDVCLGLLSMAVGFVRLGRLVRL